MPTMASFAPAGGPPRPFGGAAAVGECCSRTACALVPPKPKAERPARRGVPLATSGHAVFAVMMFLSSGRVSFGVGGMTPCFIARSSLHAPAKPAAVRVWPHVPLDEPRSGSCAAPKNLRIASSSHMSPCGVPVAWHSMYCGDALDSPNLEYVSARHWYSDSECGLSGRPQPAFETCAPSSTPWMRSPSRSASASRFITKMAPPSPGVSPPVFASKGAEVPPSFGGSAWKAEKPERTNIGSGRQDAPQSITSASPVTR
mmetsp:Transcript_46456/g.145312  ORF Transcript_46456/g.145312 Transcript_46456/m.145312 type:complete len:258 (-) Transcript_46456:111-884(-)